MLYLQMIHINYQRWNMKKAILKSQSQLLRCEVTLIELMEIRCLPRCQGFKRLARSFQQPLLPQMLLRLKRFPQSFGSVSTRVFQNTCACLLLTFGKFAKAEQEDTSRPFSDNIALHNILWGKNPAG